MASAPGRGWPRLNAWFDQLPRMTVVVGRRTLPAFRSLGIAGYHVALLAAVLTAMRSQLSLVIALGLSATAALSFFAWGLLRRAVTGTEQLVLLEHVWAAIAAVVGYLVIADGPLLAGLDALTIGLAIFLAFGRFGCLTVGCCHGTPAATGIRYGPDHDHLPLWLVNRRLRPVQLYEAIGLLAIFAIGFALAGGRPGSATVWFLASYAVLRFGMEALRGDQRPHVGAVPVARIMAVIQLMAAVWLWDRITTGGLTAGLGAGSTTELGTTAARVGPIVAVVIAGGLLTRLRSRDSNALTDDTHLGECWQLIVETAACGSTDPVMATTSLGLRIGVSSLGPGQAHVSCHHPDLDGADVARLLGAGDVTTRNGISHMIVHTPTGDRQPVPADHPVVRTGPPVGERWSHTVEGYFTGAAESTG